MRRAIRWILAGLVLCGVLMWRWPGREQQSPHAALTLEQVQELSELVTTRVQVADVQETAIRGYLGGRRVLLVVRGDLLIGVDLSRARFEAMDPQGRTAVLVLPQPRVISARLDHEHTRIAADESEGVWTVVPGDAGRTATANRAYVQAQRFLAAAAVDGHLIEASKRQAERVLRSFFGGIGWTVDIRWN